MNSRERFLTALTGGIPDRVPVAPDISNMVPCRLTGKPFWDIYLHGDPPLWKAHLDANRRFGYDHPGLARLVPSVRPADSEGHHEQMP